VPGPSQIANNFANDPKVADQLLAFKRSGASVRYGNLLTLPVGGGLLYVEPLYTIREGGAGNYPVLRFVLVSFGNQVGIGKTLEAALGSLPGMGGAGTTSGQGTGSGNTGKQGGTGPALPTEALKLLQQADQKFRAADRALKSGDLQGYASLVNQGQALVRQAVSQGQQAEKSAQQKQGQQPKNYQQGSSSGSG
jgi:uncharacterized membrane protein (UPF0182 family)